MYLCMVPGSYRATRYLKSSSDAVKAGFRIIATIKLPGTAERILKWGAENERRRRELVGVSGGILRQKILKSWVSEIVFTAFSARYFF